MPRDVKSHLRLLALLIPLCFPLNGQDITRCAKATNEVGQPSLALVPVRAQANQLNQSETASIEIKNLKSFAWQDGSTKRKYVEVREFRETHDLHLNPSPKFDVVCEVVGGPGLDSGDFFLWTTIDFLVAPVLYEYERMDNKQLSSSVGWGQMTEMRGLKSIPIYFLRPGDTRRLVMKDLDLGTVLASFPLGAENLWPWLVRVTVHVQDRSGKQLADAETTLRLSPSSRRKTGRYHDPIPPRS